MTEFGATFGTMDLTNDVEPVTVLKRNGVPACVHLGLTPQAVNAFGGYRVQGKDEQGARELLEAAIALEKAGAAMLLLDVSDIFTRIKTPRRGGYVCSTCYERWRYAVRRRTRSKM